MPVEDKVRFHTRRLETLRSNRSTWEAQWEEAAELLVPAHKNTFLGRGYGSSFNQGQKNTEKMFDATAALALQRFAAVIESLSTPQNQLWHRLVPSNPRLRENRAVRAYFDEINELVYRYRYRPSANFVGQSQKVYNSYGAYGNGMLLVDHLPDLTGLRYKNLHLGETYFLENHQGVVDTVYRAYKAKARQLITEFGVDAVPESVKKAHEKSDSHEEEWEVLHVILPREEFDRRSKASRDLPWASIHILMKEQKVLRESGYRSFPVPVTRYTQFVNETYGRGPAQLVLPSMKVLNQEKKTFLKQGHRTVDPVLLAHDDGAVGTFSLRSGAVNAGGVNAQGRALVQALPTGDLAMGHEMMTEERQTINDAFLITLFQILVENKGTMTATEVLERAREKGVLIAPTAGRQQAEFLGPMIEREIDLLDQMGVLPPAPGVLANEEYTVEYDNPMARMVRAENASGFMRSLQFALEVFNATGDPGPLDWFDFDKAMPAIQDINGAPTDWTSSEKQVAQKREERNQEAQEQKAIEAAPAMAGAMKQMGMGGA